MLTYWLMYFIAAIGALKNGNKIIVSTNRIVWRFIGFFYIILIGLRMSGGDLPNYYRRFQQMEFLSLQKALNTGDIGYQLINYYTYHWGLGFFILTLICAILSIIGLIIFLRREPNPWLGLTVAVPYLMIVVYMGYMRQGIALGLVMWGIVLLHRGHFFRFLFFIMLATTFHKSAIIMIAFGIFAGKKGKLLKILGVAVAGAGIWTAFVSSSADTLWVNYVDAQMQSQGAIIRVLLNTFPALLLLYFKREWQRYFNDYKFWLMIALASLASIGFVGLASTAVDRISLYFIPLQIVVFSRLPLLARSKIPPKKTTILVVLFYFAILFVWLNFASHAHYWLPYRNYLLQGLV